MVSILNKEEKMSTTIYKVVFLNDMLFVQERNFTTQTAANDFAATITGWKRVIKIVSSDNVTDVTPT